MQGDAASIDGLIEAAVGGDDNAWSQLIMELAPRIEHFARSHPAMRQRRLGSLYDHVADVKVACFERLAQHGRRNLARYLERRNTVQPTQTFDSWLYGTVDYAVRDHLRRRFGRAPRLAAGESSLSKRELNSGAGELDHEVLHQTAERISSVTAQLTAVEIFGYVGAAFERDEIRALHLHYVEGRDLRELAAAMNLPDEAAADRLLRKLKGRLRKRFGLERSGVEG